MRNPGKAFPRAMLLALVVVVLSTALPLLVAVGATQFPFSAFDDGFFTTVAESVVGKWLGAWIVFTRCVRRPLNRLAAAVLSPFSDQNPPTSPAPRSAIASVGMFEGEMSADSFQLMGMAERGMLPAAFARRSRHGTPTLAVLFSATGILVLSLMSFLEIVELLNTLYILATVLEYAAFLKLRFRHPELARPFRIPVSNAGMCALLALPSALLVYLLYLAPYKTWLIIGAANLVGCGLYWALGHPLRRCCRFRDVVEEGEDIVPPPASPSDGSDGAGGLLEEELKDGSGNRDRRGDVEEAKEEEEEEHGDSDGDGRRGGALRYGSDGDYVAV